MIPRVAGSSPVIHPIFRSPLNQTKRKSLKSLGSVFKYLRRSETAKRSSESRAGPTVGYHWLSLGYQQIGQVPYEN